jgi:uncharacterized protein
MASQELQRLWKLGRIDTRLVGLRKRAAALDIGASIAAEVQRLEAEEAEVGGNARALHAELRDLELRQKTIQDKIAKVDKDLFGGKITGPRAIETLEKEKEALRHQRDRDDERVLELFDIVPPAQVAAKEVNVRLDEAKARLAERKKKAAEERTALEAEYAQLSAARPEAAKGIAPHVLARYDAIRQKSDGIGMVEVLGTNCGGCGTNLPERTLQALREDKQATCESCHRLLYFTDGVI